jgi:hypothetical protein
MIDLLGGGLSDTDLGDYAHLLQTRNSGEHIWRHHRRYRITESAEEIQMRRVAQILFGYGSRARSSD